MQGRLIEDRWTRIPVDAIYQQLARLRLATWDDRTIFDRHYLTSDEGYAYPYSLPQSTVGALASRLNEVGMAFDWKAWIQKFIDEPGYNDAADYGVTVSDIAGAQFEVIGVHHLTPDENRANHNIFIDVLDKNNQRIMNASIKWTWRGRAEPDLPNPVLVGKPAAEIADLPIFPGMIIDIWHPSGNGVNGLHANHPDELGPNGEKWNTVGHHSFLVVFRKISDEPKPPPPPPDPDPEPPPPPTGEAVALHGGLQVTINQAAVAAMQPDSEGNVTIMVEVSG